MRKEAIKTKFSKFVKVKVRSFESINDDFFNALYLVNDAFLVRDSCALKEPLVSFRDEKKVLEAIQDLDITEKIIHFSPINGFKVARLVKVSKVYFEFSDATLLNFVRMLKKLNKVEISNLSTFNPAKAIESYKEKCNAKDYLPKAKENRIIKNVVADKLPKVLSHSNIEKQKIKIFENKVKIGDFRFTCYNSPIFDIAYFSISYNLNSQQDLYLLNKYFGYKMLNKFVKLLEHYKKYINILRYYRNCYYYTLTGEISYLDIKNKLKEQILSNI